MSQSGSWKKPSDGPTHGPKPLPRYPRLSRRAWGQPGAAHARPPAGCQPELHDRSGLRGYDPARLARPAGDGRVVSGGHVVLAGVRAAPGDGRVRLDIRRAIHRRGPAGAGRAGGLARDSFRHPGRAAVPAHGPGGPVLDRGRRAHAGLAGTRSRLPAMPVLRRAADARHGRGQRLLFRPRSDLDRARDRGRREPRSTSPWPWS